MAKVGLIIFLFAFSSAGVEHENAYQEGIILVAFDEGLAINQEEPARENSCSTCCKAIPSLCKKMFGSTLIITKTAIDILLLSKIIEVISINENLINDFKTHNCSEVYCLREIKYSMRDAVDNKNSFLVLICGNFISYMLDTVAISKYVTYISHLYDNQVCFLVSCSCAVSIVLLLPAIIKPGFLTKTTDSTGAVTSLTSQLVSKVVEKMPSIMHWQAASTGWTLLFLPCFVKNRMRRVSN